MTNPELPPVIYVPTTPHRNGNTESSIELRRTGDGRLALLAYSALDRLVACCGEHQAWVLVTSGNLPKLYAAQPYDVILLDAQLPEDLRYGHQAV
ncbi:SAV_915 family protein [Amycolatopsis nigrescens]|uniref:SAV_915 family protein n=1 Tax=Amycolatopsis nigrescens TaxID=381445 RepID=UPI000476C586|nr:SAV_915 family protein [Amycolatopsis nigrescens]